MSEHSSLQLTPTEASTPTEENQQAQVASQPTIEQGASSAGSVVVAATTVLGTTTTTPTASGWEGGERLMPTV